jgi:hypothetical protein
VVVAWSDGDPEDPGWDDEDPEWRGSATRRATRRRVWVSAATVLVVVSLVFAVWPTGGVVLQPRARFGPPGPQFSLSFPGAPREQTVVHRAPVRLAQYGTSLTKRFIWGNGPTAAVQVTVWVDVLTKRPPRKRTDPFIRSYLATTRGGRIVRDFGLPGAIQTVPCVPSTGRTCAGTTVSSLVVLDGTTLYDVFAYGPRATDQAVLATFRP